MRWDDRTWRTVIWALMKGVFPGVLLMLAAVVMWHIWPRDPRIASWVMLAASFLLFLKGYLRDWRLRWFTILLPGLMAIVCLMIQANFLNVQPMAGTTGMGLLITGFVLGALRGIGHSIFMKDGQLFAKPTFLVMMIWLVTYMVTQSAALFGLVNITKWGLTGSAFSTAVVTMFTLVLFTRFLWRGFRARRVPAPASSGQTTRILVVLLTVSGLMFVVSDKPALAQTSSGEQNQDLVYTATYNPKFAECTRLTTTLSMGRYSNTMMAIGNLLSGGSNQPDPTLAQMEANGIHVKVTGTDTTVTYARRLGRVDIGDVDTHIRIDSPTGVTMNSSNQKTIKTGTMTMDLHTVFEYGYSGSDGETGGQTRTIQVTITPKGEEKRGELTGEWRVVFSPDGTRGAVYTLIGDDDFIHKNVQKECHPSIPPAYLLTLQTPTGTNIPSSEETAHLLDEDAQITGPSSEGSGGNDGSGDNVSESEADAILAELQAQNLPDEAVTVGLIAGIVMLLAGVGINLAMSIATAVANAAQQGVDEATQAVAEAIPQLPSMIDPRDGLTLEMDGDKVYWDDDSGWVDRGTAQKWIDELHAEQHQKDLELKHTLADWEADYENRMSQMINHDDRPDGWEKKQKFAYAVEDFLDNELDHLSPEMQEKVLAQLDGIDWSDTYNLSDKDLNALSHTAHAIQNIREGQEGAKLAAQEHTKIDWDEDSMYVQVFGYTTIKLAAGVISPALVPVVSGTYGYLTAPPGSEIKHAVISSLASGADILLGGMNPGSITWQFATGAVTGGTETALLGGDTRAIGYAALLNASMSSVFSLAHRPNAKTAFNILDEATPAGINGPRPSVADAPAGIPGRGATDIDALPARPLGDLEASTSLGPRPTDQTVIGTRPVDIGDLDGSPALGPRPTDQTVIGSRPVDISDTKVPNRPAGMGEKTLSGGPPKMGDTKVLTSRPSLDQTQTGTRPTGSIRSDVDGDALFAKFQAETGVKIKSISHDPDGKVQVGFDPDDLTDYSAYPGQRDAAQKHLTDKWVNMRAEAEFQSRPPLYDAPGQLQTNHGVNNSIRDKHISWLTEKDAVQKMPNNYDPSTLNDDYLHSPKSIRAFLDAEQGGGHSRTFPENKGTWNWPEGTRPVAKWDKKVPIEVIEAECRALGWTKDAGGWRSPEVNKIVRQHPELNKIDQTMRKAFEGYGASEKGDHLTNFQANLSKHVNLNDPSVREQVARWTYYIADRKTETPPWFRTDS